MLQKVLGRKASQRWDRTKQWLREADDRISYSGNKSSVNLSYGQPTDEASGLPLSRYETLTPMLIHAPNSSKYKSSTASYTPSSYSRQGTTRSSSALHSGPNLRYEAPSPIQSVSDFSESVLSLNDSSSPASPSSSRTSRTVGEPPFTYRTSANGSAPRRDTIRPEGAVRLHTPLSYSSSQLVEPAAGMRSSTSPFIRSPTARYITPPSPLSYSSSQVAEPAVGTRSSTSPFIRSPTTRYRTPPSPFGPTWEDRNRSFRTDYNPPSAATHDAASSDWWRTPLPPVRQTHTCVICTDDKPHNDFLLPTSDCRHEADYCNTCMRRLIVSDLDSKGWDKIRCPDTKCKQKLSDADVKRHAPGKIYARYSDISMKDALSKLADFHRCLSPRCKSGQIHEKEDGPLFICQGCGFKQCLTHGVKWHEGDTCKEYDYRMDGSLKNKEEKASEATKRRTTRPCPKCHSPIEKNQGCDHMRCRSCHREFSWSRAGWRVGRF